MPSNLTNVYAHLRQTYLEVDMLFTKPVSYIKTLVDSEKSIFIFKEVNTSEMNINLAVTLDIRDNN